MHPLPHTSNSSKNERPPTAFRLFLFGLNGQRYVTPPTDVQTISYSVSFLFLVYLKALSIGNVIVLSIE
jgi:hypothetical protein